MHPATESDRALQEARRLSAEFYKLYYAGKYDEAFPPIERALEIREKELGLDHQSVADTVSALAVLYNCKGNYGQAESLSQRALNIREKVLEPDHPMIAGSLNNLGNYYRDRGEYGKAKLLYERALAIQEQVLEPDHPHIAQSLDNLALLYNDQSEYGKAEPLFQRALNIREKVLGPDHPMVADSLYNLAYSYMGQGAYGRAESLYQRALNIREKVLGLDHRDVAFCLGDLASLCYYRGDYVKAEKLYRRAQAIYEAVLGPEHRYVADTLGNLGNLYQNRGEFGKAEPLYQRALFIREKALGPDHPDVALALNNLASLYRERGEYEKAEPLYQRALFIREKAVGPEHPDVADTLHHLAVLFHERGESRRAEQFYGRALAIREKALGPEHPEVAESLNGLARLYAARGDLAQAIAFQSRASTIGERNLGLNLAIGSERQKLAYLALYSKETDFTLSLHSRAAPDDPRALGLAFTTLLRRKGRGLEAMTDTIASLQRHAAPENRKLFDQLAEARSQLAALTIRESGAAFPEAERTNLKLIEERIDDLEAALSAHSDEFRAQSQPVTIAAVQAAIPADGTLVEFAAFTPRDIRAGKSEPPRYLAYLLAVPGPPKWADLGEVAPIDQAIDAWRKALRDPSRSDVKRLARAVDDKVMRPVRALLRSGLGGMPGPPRRLLIAPDGSLNLIPFAALVDEQDRYLIERYTINYLTSGRDLLRAPALQPNRNAALIVANPAFGGVTGGAAQKGQASKNAQAVGQGRTKTDSRLIYFQPLPGTEGEAVAIKTAMPEAKILLWRQATETAIKQTKSPRILHIATHGFFLSDQEPSPAETRDVFGEDPLRLTDLRLSKWAAHIEDPLLRSGLALAGANEDRSGDDDGVLTALEVAGLDLWGTQLVILSACNTGVGEVKNGDGVHGLRRALVLAGSETQVISLWPVSDRITRELMVAYYNRLQQGQGRGEALRQVQLAMLKKEHRQHPFYWAAFIQSGEWANLEGRR
ncbi:MAG TPA: CHAT domain-containing tetratricopeptide repeat protein [Blastocatellia bacterium]|nr:CHAT domain-containing tetratricopeptide repeat protein [Blastocatellia bacterium]